MSVYCNRLRHAAVTRKAYCWLTWLSRHVPSSLVSQLILTYFYLDYDPNQNTFFGYMGITAALVFGNFGAAYGTAKSGVGVCSAVVLKPELLFKSIIPIVMAGILGIYGLIVAVLFNGDSKCY